MHINCMFLQTGFMYIYTYINMYHDIYICIYIYCKSTVTTCHNHQTTKTACSQVLSQLFMGLKLPKLLLEGQVASLVKSPCFAE